MPSRGKVQHLPAWIRPILDRRIVESGFANYRAHSEWLAEEGFEIGKSALQAFGVRLQSLISRYRPTADEAGAVLAAGSKDSALAAAAGIRVVQDRVFEWLMDADKDDLKGYDVAARTLAASARAAEAVDRQRPSPPLDYRVRQALASKLGRAPAGLGWDPAAVQGRCDAPLPTDPVRDSPG